MWGLMAAQVGLGALQGFLGGGAQRYQQQAQAYTQQAQAVASHTAELQQLQKQMELQGLQNTEVARANTQNLINTHITASLMNLDLAQQKRQAASNLKVNRRNAALALGATASNAAAAGTIGASVNAVASDIRAKAAEGNAEIHEQLSASRFNTAESIRSLYSNFENGYGRIDSTTPSQPQAPIMGPVYTGGSGFGGYLLGSAINVGMGYLNSRISLGLGKR